MTSPGKRRWSRMTTPLPVHSMGWATFRVLEDVPRRTGFRACVSTQFLPAATTIYCDAIDGVTQFVATNCSCHTGSSACGISKLKQGQNPLTEVCATKVALGFTGMVRVRYKRETKESILDAHPDRRGEPTNGRGNHTAEPCSRS